MLYQLVGRAFIYWKKWKFVSEYSQTEQTLIFVTLYYIFIRWKWHYLLVTVTAHFLVTILHGISLPQFPANAPDLLSGIPEMLSNVQVNNAYLLRVNYENQSVVHNFFRLESIFTVKGFKNSNSLIFTLVHQQLNTNVHHCSNWVKRQIIWM